MNGDDVAFIKAVVMMVLFAGTGLSVYWLRLRSRQLSGSSRNEIFEAVRDEVAQLRADVDTRMIELDERMDFVERRLVQEGDKPRLPGTSRIPTPV
jgi:hypothetical protein